MIKYCLEKWDKNKDKLEAVIRQDEKINECRYDYLFRLVVRYILNGEENDLLDNYWDEKNITEIDNGDYQGTILFLVPQLTYQPDETEYLMTFVNYGSCSGCDTLLGIQSDWYYDPTDQKPQKPNERQVKDYMSLYRDLVSSMIKPFNYGWRYDEKFEHTDNNE